MSKTATGSSQKRRAATSTQTNRGAPRQSSLRAPSVVQVIHDDPEFDQIHVQDWDEEAKAAADEEELIRVQQEIKRLRQEQESIMRRQAIAQRTKVQWQHINREHVRLTELRYNINFLHQ
jgi:hypothetical protein